MDLIKFLMIKRLDAVVRAVLYLVMRRAKGRDTLVRSAITASAIRLGSHMMDGRARTTDKASCLHRPCAPFPLPLMRALPLLHSQRGHIRVENGFLLATFVSAKLAQADNLAHNLCIETDRLCLAVNVFDVVSDTLKRRRRSFVSSAMMALLG
mgnify:CR=1 FL=1